MFLAVSGSNQILLSLDQCKQKIKMFSYIYLVSEANYKAVATFREDTSPLRLLKSAEIYGGLFQN